MHFKPIKTALLSSVLINSDEWHSQNATDKRVLLLDRNIPTGGCVVGGRKVLKEKEGELKPKEVC